MFFEKVEKVFEAFRLVHKPAFTEPIWKKKLQLVKPNNSLQLVV